MKNKETVEEVAEKEFPLIDTEWCRTGACEEENLHLLGHRKSFIKGAKWQAEQDKHSDDVLKMCWDAASAYTIGSHKDFKQTHPDFKEWLEQFKKQATKG